MTTRLLHDQRSPRWLGSANQYQREALLTYARAMGGTVRPWSWVSVECEVATCLDPECMTIHSPTHIDYPEGVCTYCGDPAGTRDHLMPRGRTGETLRKLIAVVPACGNCNSRIGDAYAVSVTDRRAVAHASILRAYKRLLAVPDKTPGDLRDLGPQLRSVALNNNLKRAWVRGRLAWPLDPDYDMRAFQRTGIDNPASLGLI